MPIDEWGAPKRAKLARCLCQYGGPRRRRETGTEREFGSGQTIRAIEAEQRYVAGFLRTPLRPSKPSIRLDAQDSLRAGSKMRSGERMWKPGRHIRQWGKKATTLVGSEGCRSGPDPPRNRDHDVGGLGETDDAIAAANSALDRQQRLEAWFLFTPITQDLRTGSRIRSTRGPHGPDQILARHGQAARLLHRPCEAKRMHAAAVGSAEILTVVRDGNSSSRWRKCSARAHRTIPGRCCH